MSSYRAIFLTDSPCGPSQRLAKMATVVLPICPTAVQERAELDETAFRTPALWGLRCVTQVEASEGSATGTERWCYFNPKAFAV